MFSCRMTAFGHQAIPVLTIQAQALPSICYRHTSQHACVDDFQRTHILLVLNICKFVDCEGMQVLLILTRRICWLQLYRWGYQYVENLTWVYMDTNNTILTTPSDYAQKSHLTLFIFRKEGKHVLLCTTFQYRDAC